LPDLLTLCCLVLGVCCAAGTACWLWNIGHSSQTPWLTEAARPLVGFSLGAFSCAAVWFGLLRWYSSSLPPVQEAYEGFGRDTLLAMYGLGFGAYVSIWAGLVSAWLAAREGPTRTESPADPAGRPETPSHELPP
jgi:hypothetical protein